MELAQTLEARFHEQLRDYVEQLRETFAPELESAKVQALRLRDAERSLQERQADCATLLARIEGREVPPADPRRAAAGPRTGGGAGDRRGSSAAVANPDAS